MDETLFPECVPEACQDCPALEPKVAAWRAVNKVSDIVIEGNFAMSDEEIVNSFSDEEIEHASHVLGGHYDPLLPEDRARFAQSLRTLSGELYTALGEAASSIETDLGRKIYICQSKGPVRARVPVESGKVLASFCRADLKRAPEDHAHRSIVRIKKDS